MLDSMLNGLKDQIPTELLSQVGLDSSKAEVVANLAGESAKEVVGKTMASGAMDTVMNLFSKGENTSSANSLQGTLMNNFVGKLVSSKLGLDQGKANMLASVIVPKLVEMITGKNEETDANDASGLMSMFGGADGAMDTAKDMLGDKAKDMLGGFFS